MTEMVTKVNSKQAEKSTMADSPTDGSMDG